MKVSKAIELLDLYHKKSAFIPNPDWQNAISLGLEALKRLEYCRSEGFDERFNLLLGETPENET